MVLSISPSESGWQVLDRNANCRCRALSEVPFPGIRRLSLVQIPRYWLLTLTPPQFQPINIKDGVTDTYAKV